MMGPESGSLVLTLHVALGFGGFMLGAMAIALPKFGLNSRWHRRIGRTYALCMVGMAALSVPLSLESNSVFLLVIGLLTLGWVAGGWIALRLALRARRTRPARFPGLIRTHIVLMASSYIAAWTAFLVNVRPLGSAPGLFWVYALGPSVVGTILISRASARFVSRAGVHWSHAQAMEEGPPAPVR